MYQKQTEEYFFRNEWELIEYGIIIFLEDLLDLLHLFDVGL